MLAVKQGYENTAAHNTIHITYTGLYLYECISGYHQQFTAQFKSHLLLPQLRPLIFWYKTRNINNNHTY